MADFSDIDVGQCVSRPLGEGENLGDAHTVVLQSVLNEIKAHGRSSMHKEVCGVLVGRLCKAGDSPYLLIDARIEGKYATHQSGSVTFTSETWTFINDELAAKYPEERIVGWYHTHPGFGIFLSNMDAFIHENFFSFKWQPAYVFDPQAETEGFFYWDGKNLSQEQVFVRKDVAPDEVSVKDAGKERKIVVLSAEEEKIRSSARFFCIFMSLVLVLSLAVGALFFLSAKDVEKNLRRTIDDKNAEISRLKEQNGSQSVEIKELLNTTDGLKRRIVIIVGQNTSATNEIARINIEKCALTAERERLTGEKKSLEQRLRSVQGVLDENKKKIESMEAEKNKRNVEVSTLRQQISDRERACKELNTRLEELNAKLAEVDSVNAKSSEQVPEQVPEPQRESKSKVIWWYCNPSNWF